MNFWDFDVTSDYGYRTDPFTKKTSKHGGIDFALPLNTEVTANISGEVVRTGYDADGFGNYVVVQDNLGREHYYAHLQKSSVNIGDTVTSGTSVIGLSGSTGRSTGAHLHYEVRDTKGNTMNPEIYNSDSYVSSIEGTETKSDVKWYDFKGQIKNVTFNIFKFIIIALLIILFVVFTTKSLDLNII